MADRTWSEEQLDEMRRLWNDEGLSSGQIARHFETTRNAVLGLTHRKMGFAARGQGAKPKGMGASTPKGRRPPLKRVPLPPSTPLNERRAAAERDLPSTDDLCSPKGCRFPIGDPSKAGTSEFRFCQRPRLTRGDGTRSPYCDVHHEVSFSAAIIRKPRRAAPGPHSEWS